MLVRDIGQRRLPAALITLGSGLIFGLLCVMLHKRDRRVIEHRSAPTARPRRRLSPWASTFPS